jgi:protein SCO1/2
MELMQKKWLWYFLASLALLSVAVMSIFYAIQAKQAYRGSVITPPVDAVDFTLTNQKNETTSLSAFRGKYILLFFGFSTCTNECPATMGTLMLVRDQLKDQADKVQVIFVTTDPARDTPKALGEFLNRFDSSFVGLTGSPAELQKVWKDYGVTVLDNGETHSTFVYLIDPDGKLRLTYPFDTRVEDYIADLKLLFKGN